jgi:mRNA interferase MazF
MTPGTILLANLSPAAGREQNGIRPVVVVAHERYQAARGLTIIVPLTTTDRRQRHQTQVEPDGHNGLSHISFAMPEQVRAISHERIIKELGQLDTGALDEILEWVHMFIAAPVL